MRNVRVWFTKLGQAKYISHLDINRCMTRAVRRAGIPLWFTEGFNPHPYMTFSLPLPLGVESMCESMDIKIDNDEFSNERVKESLNSVLPDGIKILMVNDVANKASDIAYGLYIFTLSTTDDINETCEKITSVIESGEIPAEKKSKSGRKKIMKQINLAEYIKEYTIKIVGEEIVINTILCSGSQKNVNPVLLADTIIKLSQVSNCHKYILRESLFTENMNKFQ